MKGLVSLLSRIDSGRSKKLLQRKDGMHLFHSDGEKDCVCDCDFALAIADCSKALIGW